MHLLAVRPRKCQRPMPPYPFKPKSSASLRAGDFWALPLVGGQYGCGRVIALKQKTGTGSRSMLLAGLMNWVGNSLPTAAELAGRGTVAQGQIPLCSIWETGGEILGNRPLSEDSIEADHFLSESPGRNCMLMRGYELVRPASAEEQRNLPVFSTWDYLVMQIKAQALAQRVSGRGALHQLVRSGHGVARQGVLSQRGVTLRWRPPGELPMCLGRKSLHNSARPQFNKASGRIGQV